MCHDAGEADEEDADNEMLRSFSNASKCSVFASRKWVFLLCVIHFAYYARRRGAHLLNLPRG